VLIGDLREANYSNAVELGRYFVTHTLRRHLVMWEQAINRALINDPATFYAEHNVEGLLRGDSLKRAQFYERSISDGWMRRSEVRRLENLPSIEGIDDEEAKAPTT
jgi:HK97 family phage portal protein